MSGPDLVERFAAARRSREHVVLEGLHALKHALRFGAEVTDVACADPCSLSQLAAALAPDVADAVVERARQVPPAVLADLSKTVHGTGVVALARRPIADAGALLRATRTTPLVVLENPQHAGNAGAAIRVAAAAGAAGVVVVGGVDPWGPAAVRGAAGLQFALPVASAGELPGAPSDVVVVDPGGEPLGRAALPRAAALVFGSERDGVSARARARATASVSIPMRSGVSSLNLATAVAVVLYASRFGAAPVDSLGSGLEDEDERS